MQVKNKLIEILLGICCLCLLGMSYLYFSKTKQTLSLQKESIIQKANEDTFHKILSRNQKAIFFSDYTPLNKNSYLCFVKSGILDSVLSVNLIDKITLFVPAHACNVCYDEVYDALRYSRDSLLIEPQVITEKAKYNEVRNLVNDLGFNINVFYLKDRDFWEKLSIAYAPFLAYLDKELECKHCFIPFPNNPEYSYEYLKNVRERYFSIGE